MSHHMMSINIPVVCNKQFPETVTETRPIGTYHKAVTLIQNFIHYSPVLQFLISLYSAFGSPKLHFL